MKVKIPLCVTALLNNSCSLRIIRVSNAKGYELIVKTNAVKVRSRLRGVGTWAKFRRHV